MNQSQILALHQFIKIAHNDINSHKECRDHASHRVMMYSYGRVVGAYTMLDNIVGSDTYAKI